MKLDWKEGEYTLHFQNGMKIEQFYFNRTFRGLSRYMYRKVKYYFKWCEAFRTSWCSSKQSPISLSLKNIHEARNDDKNKKVWIWNVTENRYNDKFRLCLQYHGNDNTHLESFSTSYSCRVDVFHFDDLVIHDNSYINIRIKEDTSTT